MKIARLRITNVLGIDEIDIAPKDVNLVAGSNGQGKSSMLTAIEAAFRTKNIDPTIIREGQPKAEILIELDSGQTVRRTITDRGSDAQVAQGKTILPKPQTVLNELVGSSALGFSPIEFFSADAKEQRRIFLQAIRIRFATLDGWRDLLGERDTETIRELGGIPEKGWAGARTALEELQIFQDWVYAQRTIENRDVDHAKKARAALEEKIPVGFDPNRFRKPVGDLYDELATKQAEITNLERKQSEVAAKRREITLLDDKIQRLEKDLKDAREQRGAAAIVAMNLLSELEAAEVPDLSELRAKIAAHEDGKTILARYDEARVFADAEKVSKEKAERLDRLYAKLTNETPRKILAQAKLPIEGLQVREDGIYFAKSEAAQPVPIKRLSQSEQIRFSLNIARALTGHLKVICIDGVEALDDASYKALMEELRLDDAHQYFVTQVAEGKLRVRSEERAKA